MKICFLIHLSLLFIGAAASPTPPLPPTTPTEDGPCRIYNSGRSADCRGKLLDSVPQRQLPPTLDTIDLSYNKLQVVSDTDFHHLPQLRVLQLQYNNISHIHNDAFKNNTLLEYLDIFNNSLQYIPAAALTPLLELKNLFMSNNLYKHATLADSFSKLVKLQVLSMGGPLVMGLKRDDFQPLKNIKLQGFAIKCSSNLSYYEPGSLKTIQTHQMGFDMAIDRLPDALHHMLHDLANKTFAVIQFRNLFEFEYYVRNDDIFQDLRYVTAHQLIFHRGKFNENLLRMALLNMQANLIKRLRLQYIDFARSPTFIDSGAGSSITNLALDKLDLWYISNPDVLRFDWRFTWLKRVKELSIRFVYFNSAPCDSWAEMEGVETLDVSNNRLKNDYIFNQRCDYRGSMPSLRVFNLSTNELTSLRDVSSLTREFRQLQVLDLSSNKLMSVEENQECVWTQNITRFIVSDNPLTSKAFGCLPTSVRYLDLSYCNLDQLDMAFFKKATNLEHLLLSGNKIKFIPLKWESPSLRFLALDGNSFGLISMESFQHMPQLSELRAGNNPYHCICELHVFVQNTISKQKVNLTDWPLNYRCYHPEPFVNTLISNYLPAQLACDIRLVIITSVAVTTVVILIFVLICYIFDLPWYTKATYQIIRAKYRAHKEKAAGELETFTYHAFISYSHSDADWVREQLLPCLENNRNPYRLCIHERDFMPGKWIIDNIIENIESSRKVIFVLSRHFVNSEWCNYELYFAQQRAMGKTFSDVILVVKEPIDPSSLPSKYCKLKKMLSTKTYLEWPQQPNQQHFFWAQLRSVLGKPTMTRDRANSVRSMNSSVGRMSVIAPRVEEMMPEEAVPDANKKAEPEKDIIDRYDFEVSGQAQIHAVELYYMALHGLTWPCSGSPVRGRSLSDPCVCSQVTEPRYNGGGERRSCSLSTLSIRQCQRVQSQQGKMSANLQGVMEDLIKVFYRYSGKEGDKYKLNKRELKQMFQAEFAEGLADPIESSEVDKIMKDLDANKDGEVDFQEFIILVAALTVACNDFFLDLVKNSKKN
ncbi:toll-like receptor 18 [Cololabis saira]|uniref:toll-like receptor 18 n=1 Tax=Cololabis saira TaxID=129043 RepID=UPI002AD3040A|nr:toll-like receptor 18 [Cololabis saira]